MTSTADTNRLSQAALPCPPARAARWFRRLAFLALAGLLFLPMGDGRAQFIIKDDQAKLPIDAALRAQVIEGILKQVGDNYVFPEVAKKMEKAIRRRLKNKEYDKITSGQELAKKLTADLQEVSRDKH